MKRSTISLPAILSSVISMIFFSNGFFVVLTSINGEIPLEIYSFFLSVTSSPLFANPIYVSVFILALYGNLTIAKELRKNSRKKSIFFSFNPSELESFSKDFHSRMYTVLLPAFNEEKEIGYLLSDLISIIPPNQIIVVDNNSIDRTAEIARDKGVTVIYESNQGKANAIRTGLEYVIQQNKYQYIIMMDADGTYLPKDIEIFNRVFNEYTNIDVIIGSRLNGNIEKGAMTYINRKGNIILSSIARELYGNDFSDICSGFWGFTAGSIKKLLENGIDSSGFGLEGEMVSSFSKMGITFGEVPITYCSRKNSVPKLNPIVDGFKIFSILIKKRL